MPRHIVVLEGAYGMIEDFMYLIGDAEDFVERERVEFRELIDDVADSKVAAYEAKRRIDEAFANAAKQLREARDLAAANGRRMGFSHLHEAFRDIEAPRTAGIRLVLPFSGESA